jgi:hypothetical protein
MRKPSPAMVVALLALFVALGGVGVAATGGNFILGQSNGAGNTTSLSSGVTSGATLSITNTGGKPAGRFSSNSGVPPLAVNNGTRIPNLNADKLDGFDSSSFLPWNGTAYNSSLLGGQPPSYYETLKGSIREWTWAIASFDMAGYSDGSATANCPTGSVVLGGGWSVATGDDPDFFVKQSAPIGPPLTGWNVIARNTGNDHTITTYVWAICAKAFMNN